MAVGGQWAEEVGAGEMPELGVIARCCEQQVLLGASDDGLTRRRMKQNVCPHTSVRGAGRRVSGGRWRGRCKRRGLPVPVPGPVQGERPGGRGPSEFRSGKGNERAIDQGEDEGAGKQIPPSTSVQLGCSPARRDPGQGLKEWQVTPQPEPEREQGVSVPFPKEK